MLFRSGFEFLFVSQSRYAASPATGALAIHTLEQDRLLSSAFNFKALSIPNPQSSIRTAPHLPSYISDLPKKKFKTSRASGSPALSKKRAAGKLKQKPKK